MNNKTFKIPDFFLLIQLSAISVFLGRAWQHLFWDAPFRALLWDEAWMKSLVESLSALSWKEYITSNQIDDQIQFFIQGMGVFYLICFLVALAIKKLNKPIGSLLILGAFSLFFLAALYCKEKFFSLGQLLEYTLQFSSPIFLYIVHFEKDKIPQLIKWMKLAIGFTFICHGLYAVNYYPRPGDFVQMTMDITGLGESSAVLFLNMAGILDFIAAAMLLLPGKVARWALIYMAFWGFSTAVARVWANFYWEFPWRSIHQWLYEAVMRLPHALIPLAVWVYYSRREKEAVLKGSVEEV